MPQKKEVIFANGIIDGHCPNCGNVMADVEYYSARPIKQEEMQLSMNTRKVITTYTDINPHIGHICLACMRANQKSKRTAGKVLLIIGGAGSFISMMAGVIVAQITEINGGNIGAAMTPGMVSMILLIFVAVFGLALYLGNRDIQDYTQDHLFSIFALHMYKMKNHKGVILSPADVAKLEKK